MTIKRNFPGNHTLTDNDGDSYQVDKYDHREWTLQCGSFRDRNHYRATFATLAGCKEAENVIIHGLATTSKEKEA